jgi:hypothetical protein
VEVTGTASGWQPLNIVARYGNALDNRAIQRDFANDPVSWAARTYLSVETMSL